MMFNTYCFSTGKKWLPERIQCSYVTVPYLHCYTQPLSLAAMTRQVSSPCKDILKHLILFEILTKMLQFKWKKKNGEKEA
jgi:hypothetical protein